METVEHFEDFQSNLKELEGVVAKLKVCKSQQEIEHHMKKYVQLEDSLLLALQNFTKSVTKSQEDLTPYFRTYNKLPSNFQDSWTQSFWYVYELVRNTHKNQQRQTRIELSDTYSESTRSSPEASEPNLKHYQTILKIPESHISESACNCNLL